MEELTVPTDFWVYAVTFAIVSLIVRTAYRWWRRQGGAGWTLTPATVYYSDTTRVDGTPTFEIVYSYSVGGEFYSGTYRAVSKGPTADAAAMTAFAQGAAIMVRVDPHRPEASVLLLEDNVAAQSRAAAR